MKKLLAIALLTVGIHSALTAASTSCQRLVEMLDEQPDLQSAFAATPEYQQCEIQNDALDTVTRSPKPERALAVAQQLVQDGHKVTLDHVEQCMHAYWSARFQAGRITPSSISAADLSGLCHAGKWTAHALHHVRLAQLLATSLHTGSTLRCNTHIDFDRIVAERLHEIRLLDRAVKKSLAIELTMLRGQGIVISE